MVRRARAAGNQCRRITHGFVTKTVKIKYVNASQKNLVYLCLERSMYMFMMYPHYGSFFGFGWLPFIFILGVVLFIWILSVHRDDNEEPQGEDSALEILKKRYAKGEITKRQYLEMKKDIE